MWEERGNVDKEWKILTAGLRKEGLWYLSVRTSPYWNAERKKKEKREQSIKQICDIKKGYIHMMRIQEKGEGTERNMWRKNSWEFFKVNNKHQTADPGNSDNTKHSKYQNIYTSANHTQLRRTRDKVSVERGQRGENLISTVKTRESQQTSP